MDHVEIARADSPRGEIVLRERRDANTPSILELRVNGVFVMDTLETTTERALAQAALALVDRPERVLVGGLGLGFTLHEVLADSRVESCTVVEIEQAVVDWMRDGTVAHGPKFLADERATVVVADVAVALTEAGEAAYDLVLLDVDNGPGYLVHEANQELYEAPFLVCVRAALRPGGALVVWSADEAPALERTLAATFDGVEARPLDVRLQDRDVHYWLYVARATPGTDQEKIDR